MRNRNAGADRLHANRVVALIAPHRQDQERHAVGERTNHRSVPAVRDDERSRAKQSVVRSELHDANVRRSVERLDRRTRRHDRTHRQLGQRLGDAMEQRDLSHVRRTERHENERFPRVRFDAFLGPNRIAELRADVSNVSVRRGLEVEPRARLDEHAIDATQLIERVRDGFETDLCTRAVQERRARSPQEPIAERLERAIASAPQDASRFRQAHARRRSSRRRQERGHGKQRGHASTRRLRAGERAEEQRIRDDDVGRMRVEPIADLTSEEMGRTERVPIARPSKRTERRFGGPILHDLALGGSRAAMRRFSPGNENRTGALYVLVQGWIAEHRDFMTACSKSRNDRELRGSRSPALPHGEEKASRVHLFWSCYSTRTMWAAWSGFFVLCVNPFGGLMFAIPYAYGVLHLSPWLAAIIGWPLSYVQVVVVDLFWNALWKIAWWRRLIERKRTPRLERIAASKTMFWSVVAFGCFLGPWLVMAVMRLANVPHRRVGPALALSLLWNAALIAFLTLYVPQLLPKG